MSTYAVIDSDGHLQEPWDLWSRYLPEAMRDRVQVFGDGWFQVAQDSEEYRETNDRRLFRIDDVDMPPAGPYKNVTKPTSGRTQPRYQDARTQGWSPKSQLEGMDVEGVDAAVLFPTHGLVIQGIDGVDPAVTTAMSTAYNTWVAEEFLPGGEGRLFATAMIDVRDVDGAVKEARRAIGELGLTGVFLRPNPVGGRTWYHPDYDPLWATLQELDASVSFHEGGAVRLPQIGPDRFDLHPLWHTCTHPMEQMMAMLAIVMGGVAERFPALRFGFLECGASWLPYWMWRMDEKYEEEHIDLQLTMSPTEYVERQCFVSIDSDEAPGVFTIETLEQPRVVWGSDYPHHDGKYPVARSTVSSLPGMTPERIRRILHEAPLALFGERLAQPLAGLTLTAR